MNGDMTSPRVHILFHQTNVTKRLKISKGQSEAVNRRRTDNKMIKRKKDNDLQNTKENLNNTNPTKTRRN